MKKIAYAISVLILSANAHAQQSSAAVPGMSYASSTVGSTVAGGMVMSTMNSSTNNTAMAIVPNYDMIGMRVEANASIGTNNALVDASRLLGGMVMSSMNSSINSQAIGRAGITTNSATVK